MGAIIDYLWAVFYTKWAGMFALLVGIDELLEWAVPGYRDWLNERFSQRTRRITLLVAFIIFVFLAGFFVWDDERVERLNERAKHLALEEISKGELREAQEKIVKLESQPRIGEEAKAQIDSLIQTNQQLQQKVEALEQQAVPRRLTDEQRKNLADVLKEISLKQGFSERPHRLIFEVLFGCNECRVFAGDIIGVWRSSPGWEVKSTNNLSIDPKFSGIVVGADLTQCSSVEAELISGALRAGGISHSIGRITDEEREKLSVPDGFCSVFIGNKLQQER